MTARNAAWAPSLVFLLHAVGFFVFRAYDVFPPLDIPMHFLGGLAIGYFFYRAALNAATIGLVGSCEPVMHNLLVFAWVATSTVFWEFAEYLCDRFFGTHTQGDVEDTLLDMLMGIAGVLFLLVAIRLLASAGIPSTTRANIPLRASQSAISKADD
jgi:hypothetical protein